MVPLVAEAAVGAAAAGDCGIILVNMPVENVSVTRNSALRARTSGLTTQIAQLIYEKASGVTADHLTILGTLGVVVGAHQASKNLQRRAQGEPNTSNAIPAAVMVAGALLDGIDGSVARYRDSLGIKRDKKKGPLKDAISDGIQEAYMYLAQAVAANKRGDRLGEFSAYTAAITSSWARAMKAAAEAKGRAVPEDGSGLLQRFGTRQGRDPSGIAVSGNPNPNGLPLQAAVAVFTATANVATTYERYKIATNSNEFPPELDSDAMADSALRRDALAAVCVLGFIAAAKTYQHLHKDSSQ